MANGTNSQREKKPAAKSKREWAPRMWIGIDFFGWMRLLARNRFRVGWQFWHHALLITILSVANTFFRYWCAVTMHWKMKQTKIEQPPIFILGHWRAGTTLLHEMMVVDPRFTAPNTFQCFAPNHFLESELFLVPLMRFLIPSRRPMDNMPAAWDRAQEEEFAFVNLGLPSPYASVIFPADPKQDREYLTLENVPPADLARWKNVFVTLLRQVTLRTPKRLVLKSPAHTARVRVLLELFPEARFVHIVRDPYVVFPSTVNLWKKLSEKHGLQKPNFAGLEDYVLETFEQMYDRFEADRELIDPSRFCELKYEDLVRDPVGELRNVYERLDLGGFEENLPALQKYLASVEGHEKNRYSLSPEMRDQVTQRWSRFFRRYGYAAEPAESQRRRAG